MSEITIEDGTLIIGTKNDFDVQFYPFVNDHVHLLGIDTTCGDAGGGFDLEKEDIQILIAFLQETIV